MLLITIKGGLASQINLFYFGYLISKFKKMELVLEISDFYNGYQFPYYLDSICSLQTNKLLYKYSYFGLDDTVYFSPALIKHFTIIHDGNELIEMFQSNETKNYYIINEYYCYSDFWNQYPQFQTTHLFFNKNNLLWIKPLRKSVMDKLEKIYLQMSRNKSENVAIHIRQNDFCELGIATDFIFYKAAIAYLLEIKHDLEFYFFSDNLNVVKKSFGNYKNYHYVYLGDTDRDLLEFFVISHCEYSILSSGSGYSLLSSQIASNKKLSLLSKTLDSTSEDSTTKEFVNNHCKPLFINTNRKGYVYLEQSDVEYYSIKYNNYLKDENLPVNKEHFLHSYTILCIQNKMEELEELYYNICLNSFYWTSKDIKNLYLYKELSQNKSMDFPFLTENSKTILIFPNVVYDSKIKKNLLQILATLLSIQGHDIHYIARKIKVPEKIENPLNWTKENTTLALCDYASNQIENMKIVPYHFLNNEEILFHYLHELSNSCTDPIILITRKPHIFFMKK